MGSEYQTSCARSDWSTNWATLYENHYELNMLWTSLYFYINQSRIVKIPTSMMLLVGFKPLTLHVIPTKPTSPPSRKISTDLTFSRVLEGIFLSTYSTKEVSQLNFFNRMSRKHESRRYRATSTSSSSLSSSSSSSSSSLYDDIATQNRRL